MARWSLVVTFATAMGGTLLYFLEDSGHVHWISALTGLEHSYSKLLVITITILVAGLVAFWCGLQRQEDPRHE